VVEGPGFEVVNAYWRGHGLAKDGARDLAWQAIDRVGMREAATRRTAGYSKGMRQRIRLAQAIAHRPQVLILDEPLNGLDPMARSEVIEIFKSLAEEGCHVIISSHVLHEVDMVSDRVVLLSGGYVVAEGDVDGVRQEVQEVHERPIQILIRCSKASTVASRFFAAEVVTEAEVHDDGLGLLVRTRRSGDLYSLMNELVIELDLEVETVTVADSDVRAVYAYLIENEGEL